MVNLVTSTLGTEFQKVGFSVTVRQSSLVAQFYSTTIDTPSLASHDNDATVLFFYYADVYLSIIIS